MTLSSSSDFNGTTSQKLTRFFNIFEYIFWTEVLAVIYGSVSLFGIVTNLINIRTFVKMYVTGDGVTLAFLLLAKSDLGLCCSSLVMSVISFFATFEIKGILFFPFANTASLRFLSQVDPNVIGNSAMSIMTVFNITTTLITLYVAVTRCLCVKRPLQFRNLVSCKRTIATVSCFFLFGLGTRLPVLAHMGVHMMFDPIYNASRPTLWLHPNRELIKDMMWIVCDQSLSLVTQVALLLCVIIMARSLRAANKFRQTATMAKDTADQNCSKDAQFNGSNPKLNAKEARIIQQLIIISFIFIVCNVPKLTRNFATIFLPDFDIGGTYQSLYFIAGLIVNICDVLNSSANMFVYYTYHSNFRKMCTVC